MPRGGRKLPCGVCWGLPTIAEAVATKMIEGSVGLTRISLIERPVKTLAETRSGLVGWMAIEIVRPLTGWTTPEVCPFGIGDGPRLVHAVLLSSGASVPCFEAARSFASCAFICLTACSRMAGL